MHLKYAVEVEKTGSITQAADNLYMGQPNLRKAIKELEGTLGTPIFRRTSKGVIPTPRGQEFLNYAKRILAQVEEMESLYKVQNDGRLTFSISIPRASYISHAYTCFINALDTDKEMDFTVRETNSMSAIHNLVQEGDNLGVIRYQAEHEKYFLDTLADKGIKHEQIWEFEYLALMSDRHPLARVDTLRHEELARYTEIVHGDLFVPSLPFSEVKKSPAAGPVKKCIHIYERGSQFDLLCQVPTTYMWVSPLPEETLNRYHLVQRACVGATAKHKDVLIYRGDYTFKDLDLAFIAQVKAARDKVAAGVYR
nr:LysR family transcriptional regulator [bacterium]